MSCSITRRLGGPTGPCQKDGPRGRGAAWPAAGTVVLMQSTYLQGITIRPLRNGDTLPVAALLDRLGAQSRARRFGGAKPRLSGVELHALARVDDDHHV